MLRDVKNKFQVLLSYFFEIGHAIWEIKLLDHSCDTIVIINVGQQVFLGFFNEINAV